MAGIDPVVGFGFDPGPSKASQSSSVDTGDAVLLDVARSLLKARVPHRRSGPLSPGKLLRSVFLALVQAAPSWLGRHDELEALG